MPAAFLVMRPTSRFAACSRKSWLTTLRVSNRAVRKKLAASSSCTRLYYSSRRSRNDQLDRSASGHTLMAALLLEARNLRKSFPTPGAAFPIGARGHVTAVDDVSLELPAGETLAIVG